jgi:hypothetical protein
MATRNLGKHWISTPTEYLNRNLSQGALEADNHALLRRLLFLVAIENLFDCGRQNAMQVLWTYGEQLECVDQISERLAETEEEITQVQAHFEAVFCQ